jgi:hypothetical protein
MSDDIYTDSEKLLLSYKSSCSIQSIHGMLGSVLQRLYINNLVVVSHCPSDHICHLLL